MEPTHARYLSAVRHAVPYAALGAAEVRQSITAERTVIEMLSPEGIVAITTIYTRRLAPSGPPAQLELPAVAQLPAPAPAALPTAAAAAAPEVAAASASDELVELLAVEGWEPIAHQEALDPTTMVLWTPESTDPEAEQRWRTVVTPVVAARLHGLAPGCFERRAPTAPSHLVRVGDVVATNRGPLAVAGLVRDDDAGAGVAFTAAAGAEYPVAWADTAAVVDGAMFLSIGGKYVGRDLSDDWWEAVHVNAAAVAAKPAKKARAKKAGAA